MQKTLSLLLIQLLVVTAALSQKHFVKSKNGQFKLDDKFYYYIGTNYWYGSFLALEKDPKRGIERLRTELDFLKQNGVTNLRVIGGAEGSGKILGNYRVGPPLQPSKNVFDTSVLYGLDVLLDEMDKRDMKAVIFFSNNWEWSGGFLQYLNWNGLLSDAALQEKMEWETMRDNISKFYTSEPCKDGYLKQVDVLLKRKNTVNGRKYTDDPVIMSWQIANEPRPMRPAANNAYKQWIKDVAGYIKGVDKNHLVSIGHEGEIGTQDINLYEEIHADKNIDYLTIHIWPKNWQWMRATHMQEDYNKVDSLTTNYITKHLRVADHLNKPLVIEEFGFPRDHMQFAPATPTKLRDKYYHHILSFLKNKTNNLAGINFWAFNGVARPIKGQLFWKPGDDYMGDPPMEEQSLYGVFDTDITTWKVISQHVRRLRK